MAKQPNQAMAKQPSTTPHDLQRGQINDNALKAMVTSPLFKSKVMKTKKGKGSFNRHEKHKGQEPYLMAA